MMSRRMLAGNRLAGFLTSKFSTRVSQNPVLAPILQRVDAQAAAFHGAPDKDTKKSAALLYVDVRRA